MRYLLDTNIVSDMVRHPGGLVARHFARVGQHNICISVIVAAELRFGILREGSPAVTTKINALLDRLSVMPFDDPADRRYAEVRARLESEGTLIGANDMLIAAHALALDCTLVTDNEREFSRVKNLQIENWLH